MKKLDAIINLLCVVGFFVGLITSFVYCYNGNDLRAIYFLGFSAYCWWMVPK